MDEVPLSSILLRGLAIVGLIAANAFFVSAEFSLVAARRARIHKRAEAGDKKAKQALRAIQSLDRSIAATQLGITLASVGLIWIAEPAVAALLQRAVGGAQGVAAVIASHAFAVILTFVGVVGLQVVFGQFIPKAIALNHPINISRWVAAPLMLFAAMTGPLLLVLNRTTTRILRLVGLRQLSEGDEMYDPEEILTLVERSQKSGHFDTQDVQLIKGVLEFTQKAARDVMTPRTEVIALEANLTVEEAAARVAEEGRSRYPVVRESLDDIIGIVHAKQILSNLRNAKYQEMEDIMQDAFFVPGSREIEDLLADMQRLKRHMAIVLDEYGGTAGIVTMEDLIEEIVGEIEDEYDEPVVELEPSEHATTLQGSMEIDEANERFGFEISSDHYTTVGGYVFGALGRLPRVDDRVSVKNGTLEVIEMDERRVGILRIRPGVDEAKDAV
ncbi:MAG: HlyC/CorC family transporter [Gemmatimonadetes bacterium]|nr:HlyC/CorC family transporter [Gemmatimonadota bacterium]